MTTRQEKIQELLREEISDILRREIKDPRLGFVTVTGAEVSPDLRHAKVFVSIMGSEEERAQNMAILKNAEHFIRQAFGKRARMKIIPEIEFRLDTSVDHGVRILELLEQIRHEEEERKS
jgi:ribosome-binding factor A